MMAPQIQQELINEWKKKGELISIWGCDRCFKKIPFYKSGDEVIDHIYLWWSRDHKYCDSCKKKIENNNKIIKKPDQGQNIKELLEKYEPEYEDSLIPI